MTFEFATAGRLLVGAGVRRDLGVVARGLGRVALLVTGRSTERTHDIERQLADVGLAVVRVRVPGEPDVRLVEQGALTARQGACDVVVAVGGGSVLDAGKAIAALATNDQAVSTYLEVIGAGEPLTAAALPVVAVPTTAGTGSEVTRNAVITSPVHRVKVSLRSASMLPSVAVVDPELALSLPAALTATTGMDALTQLIEAYVSSRANPMTDALCAAGLRRAAMALRTAVARGHDREARMDMALASLWSGMALANAGLGAVHGIAGPLGGLTGAPHGALCAALLGPVTAVNLDALERQPQGRQRLRRFEEVARLLTGSPTATAAGGLEWICQLTAELGIPPLRAHGLAAGQVADLAAQALRSSSMKGNPVALTPDQVAAAIHAAL